MATKQNDTTTVKAAANLTTAYSGWISDGVDIGLATEADLRFTFTTGDATSFTFYLEFESQDGTTWYPDMRISGSTAVINEITWTASGASATDLLNVPINVASCRKFRVKAKKTGGSGTVTLAAVVQVGVAA